jgi:hypothetical protein
MIFSVDRDAKALRPISEQSLSSLNVRERTDLQEWIIDRPDILGEDLLIIQAEYGQFEETRDRLDLLALDPNGKLVVIELKLDEADDTTDLQAIKYASYCATLTFKEIQQDYRSFRKSRGNTLTPEEVGQTFEEFLEDAAEEMTITEEGWASFTLDDKPRVILVAGSFNVRVTAPVVWLIEEYEMDITCVTVQSYVHDGELLLSARRVIPIQEAESYMTRRRAKQEQQRQTDRRKRAVEALLDRGLLEEGDIVELDIERLNHFGDAERWEEVGQDFCRAEVTGRTGRSNNFVWLKDGDPRSASGLVKSAIQAITGERPRGINGYKYLIHPDHERRTLADLRNNGVDSEERKT